MAKKKKENKKFDADKFYNMIIEFFAEERKKEAEEQLAKANTPKKTDQTKPIETKQEKPDKPIIDENNNKLTLDEKK